MTRNMDNRNADLAALIGSRICHDLISPIGAISNGLELLDLTGSAAQGPELDLIADSAGNAGARIRFFRIAFGAAGDQEVGRAEILSILDDIGCGWRLKVTWAAPGPQKRADLRLAFLALMCCETAMAYGGTVTVTVDDQQRWAVDGRADKLSFDAALWERVSKPGQSRDLTPAQVQFALLPVLAQDSGRRIVVTQEEGRVLIEF